jgi:PAS domain-containing protein
VDIENGARYGGGDMTTTQIDYMSVFRYLPVPVLIIGPDFVILDMNDAYLGTTSKTRGDLVGNSVFSAFPENPAEPGREGWANFGDSLRRVVSTGEPEILPLQRFDIEDEQGAFAERYWCPVYAPVRGADGNVSLILHVVEEVPDLIRKFVAAEAASALFPAEVDEQAAEVLRVLLDPVVKRLDVLALEEPQHVLLELA